LQPNTVYSFKVKAVNGCNGSGWSKVVQIKTKGKFADLTQKFLSLNPFSAAKPVNCQYTVKSGDSLWKIASLYLGSGKKFSQLIAYNPEIFNGNIGSFLKIGWNLKVC
jgi:LysM repeat protein